MSLLDSLLFEDYRVNVWIAARTDGIKGSGTIGDPYDGSTAAKFDALMRDVAALTTATVGVRVNLGPGIFETAGYYDGISAGTGWQPTVRMKIVGSGIDVTTLKLVSSASANSQAFAIGHVLGNNTAQVDFFEISDLTIDCNLAAQTNNIAAGAIRIKGNHSRIRRVKAIHWGTRTTSNKVCLVIASITADPCATIPGVFDTVIDECMVIEPDYTWVSTGSDTAIALHVGDATNAATDYEPLGESAVIRNCFVDGTAFSGGTELVDLTQDIRALSTSCCHGAIIEGNQIYNVRYGGPHQSAVSVPEAIVRNNFYKNVIKAPFLDLGRLGTTVTAASASLASQTVTVTTSSTHRLQVGHRIQVVSGTTGTLQTFFEITEVPDTTHFKFALSSGSLSGAFTFKKVLGVDKLLVEGNTVELALSTSGETPVGIHIADQSLISTRPPFPNGQIILRDNRIRYVDGLMDAAYTGYAIEVQGASDLIVRNNVLELAPPNPIKNFRCGLVDYFNNTNPGGTLIRGYDATNIKYYDELSTDTEDAFVLAFFKKG